MCCAKANQREHIMHIACPVTRDPPSPIPFAYSGATQVAPSAVASWNLYMQQQPQLKRAHKLLIFMPHSTNLFRPLFPSPCLLSPPPSSCLGQNQALSTNKSKRKLSQQFVLCAGLFYIYLEHIFTFTNLPIDCAIYNCALYFPLSLYMSSIYNLL